MCRERGIIQAQMLRLGDCDLALCGVSESIRSGIFAGFASGGTATHTDRRPLPFDVDLWNRRRKAAASCPSG
jgi:hypothetical protein